MFTFFVANIWLVGMCVPSNDPDLINGAGTLGSPFVIALKRADVWGLAHAINGFIFLSVISCGVTSVYVASRSLTALADLGIVHGFFGRKDSAGRPYVAIAICLVLGGGLCYLNVDSTGTVVYGWFSSLVCISPLSPPFSVVKCFAERTDPNRGYRVGRNSNPFPMGLHLHRASPLPNRSARAGQGPVDPPLQGYAHALRAVL
jgi:amino acid transporter